MLVGEGILAILSGVMRQEGKTNTSEIYFADSVLKNMRIKHFKLKVGTSQQGTEAAWTEPHRFLFLFPL